MYKIILTALTFMLAPLAPHAADGTELSDTKIGFVRTHVFSGNEVDLAGKHREFFANITPQLAALDDEVVADLLSRMGPTLFSARDQEDEALALCIQWLQGPGKEVKKGDTDDLLSAISDASEGWVGYFMDDLRNFLTGKGSPNPTSEESGGE